MERRDFLKAAGIGVAGGLAGCPGDGDDPTQGPGPETDEYEEDTETSTEEDPTATSQNYECVDEENYPVQDAVTSELSNATYNIEGVEESYEQSLSNNLEEHLSEDSELTADEIIDTILETSYGGAVQSEYSHDTMAQIGAEVDEYLQNPSSEPEGAASAAEEDYEEIIGRIEDEIFADNSQCESGQALNTDSQYVNGTEVDLNSLVAEEVDNQDLTIEFDDQEVLETYITETDLDNIVQRAEIATEYDDDIGIRLVEDYFAQNKDNFEELTGQGTPEDTLSEKEVSYLSEVALQDGLMPEEENLFGDWSGDGIDNETLIDLQAFMNENTSGEHDYFDPVRGEQLLGEVMTREIPVKYLVEGEERNIQYQTVESEEGTTRQIQFAMPQYGTEFMDAEQVAGMMERAFRPLDEAFRQVEDEKVRQGIVETGELVLGTADAFTGAQNANNWTATEEVRTEEGFQEQLQHNFLSEGVQRLVGGEVDVEGLKTMQKIATVNSFRGESFPMHYIKPETLSEDVFRREAAKFPLAASNAEEQPETLEIQRDIDLDEIQDWKDYYEANRPTPDNIRDDRNSNEVEYIFQTGIILDSMLPNIGGVSATSNNEEDNDDGGDDDDGDGGDDGDDGDDGSGGIGGGRDGGDEH